MTGRVFIDSNVVVYANDGRDPAKQRKAAEIVAKLMKNGTGVISTQVLQEYASVALTKLKQDDATVLRVLRLLETMTVVQSTPLLVRRAVELRRVYEIGFWDAGIIAAAEEADCDSIVSEDLNAGQYYGGIRAIDPFAPAMV
jgi:predicted nucleic acid-binding protein